MSANRYSAPDRSSAIVVAGMVLLAVLGVITVFHEPIAAIFAGPQSEAPPPPPPAGNAP